MRMENVGYLAHGGSERCSQCHASQMKICNFRKRNVGVDGRIILKLILQVCGRDR
jgi:hypothetical protein